MEATRQPKRSGRGNRGGPEPRVVAIQVRPAPDAEARLRRLGAILLKHATRDPRHAGGGDGEECDGR